MARQVDPAGGTPAATEAQASRVRRRDERRYRGAGIAGPAGGMAAATEAQASRVRRRDESIRQARRLPLR